MEEPCNWPEAACPAPDDVTPEALEDAYDEAVWTLWILTGQRFGQCEVTIASPPLCLCSGRCRCDGCTLWLPGPVGDVSEVTVDGVVTTDYELIGTRLLRTTPWPTLAAITVTYTRGYPVPPGGARAVGELRNQIALQACGSSKCQLPSNWEQRTRNGDTVRRSGAGNASRRPQDELTGLPSVDRWILTARRLSRSARVWSPDVEEWQVTAGPTPPSP